MAELVESLKQFPEAVQERAIKDGVSKGARDLAVAMRRAAYAAPAKTPAGFTGTLRRAIRAVVGRHGDALGKAWIGLKKIRGESRLRFYYKTLEYGRKPGKRKIAGSAYARRWGGRKHYKYRAVAGTAEPLRPFFVAAWRANKDAIADDIVEATAAAVYAEAGKAYAKSKSAQFKSGA